MGCGFGGYVVKDEVGRDGCVGMWWDVSGGAWGCMCRRECLYMYIGIGRLCLKLPKVMWTWDGGSVKF